MTWYWFILIMLGTLASIWLIWLTIWALLSYGTGRKTSGRLGKRWTLPFRPTDWMDYWEERGEQG